MADHRAITAVAETVVQVLRTSYDVGDFGTQLDFSVFTSRDFTSSAIANGASLFVYRVFPHGSWRTPAGRLGQDGRRLKSALPLEMHFLLTVWGGEASLQNTLAGWILRMLEDNPILPAGVLNTAVPGVFRADESVELVLAEVTNEDLLRIWEVLGLGVYQLSIPYLARVIHLESIQKVYGGGPPVQEREAEMAVLEAPEEAP